MSLKVFNTLLLIGWLMVMIGIALWSIPAGLAVGGALLLGLTVFFALRAGVHADKDKPRVIQPNEKG